MTSSPGACSSKPAVLIKGGELWIVGNRHLGYHAKLKKLFRGVEQIAATPKFVVLKAIK